MAQGIIISSAVANTALPPTVPGNVTGITLTGAISGQSPPTVDDYTAPDAAGNVYVKIAAAYVPPSPLGVFTGVHAYDEMPDGSGSAPRQDLGLFILGTDALNALAEPHDAGDHSHDPANPVAILNIPAPGAVQVCRVYLTSRSQNGDNKLVLATESSPTPSATITIPPPPAAAIAGEEYAPKALNCTLVDGYPKYRVIDGGTQQYQYAITWEDPTSDRRFNLLAGYAIALDQFDPDQGEVVRHNEPPAPVGGQPYVSRWHDVPADPVDVTVWLDSYTGDGSKYNSIVPGVTPSATFRVQRQRIGTGDQLYTSDISGAACTASYRTNPVSGQLELIFLSDWVEPDDATFGGITLVLVNADFPLPGVPLTGQSMWPQQTPAIVSGWPDAPDTWRMYFQSNDTSLRQNPLIDGVTPFVDFDVDAQSPLPDATGFSVTVTDTAADSNGKPAKLITVNFVPADDPRLSPPWFVADIPGYGWTPLGYPSPGDVFNWEDIPKTIVTWAFILVARDVNNKDRDGNSSPNWASPPTGTPALTRSVGPPPDGSTGQEKCANVTGFTITLGAAVTTPDGTSVQSVTAAWTAPADTRFGSLDLITKYGDGVTSVATPVHSARVSPLVFTWKIPSPSQTVRWLALARDVNDRPNTLDDNFPTSAGVTPHYDVTAGATQQLDLSATKLASLSAQFTVDPTAHTLNIQQVIADLILGGQLQIGGGTKNGIVSVSGHNVTYVSGDHFDSSVMIDGYPITINGVSQQINHVSSTTAATIVGSATLSNVPYSFGRAPQAKWFDRNNAPLAFIGDDFFNTGYVGAWLASMVRLGGTIGGTPAVDVDSTGKVTISFTSANTGAVAFQVNLNGVTVTISNASDSNLGGQFVGLKISDNSTTTYAAITANGIFLLDAAGVARAQLALAGSGSTSHGVIQANHFNGNSVVLNPDTPRVLVNGIQVVTQRQTIAAVQATVISPSLTNTTRTAAGTYGSNEQSMLADLKTAVANANTAINALAAQLNNLIVDRDNERTILQNHGLTN